MLAAFLASHTLTLKALHIAAVVAWVGAQASLPFLLDAIRRSGAQGAEAAVARIAARRIIRLVMNPAMPIALLLGFSLAAPLGPEAMRAMSWLAWKLALVAALIVAHGLLVAQFARLARGDAIARAAPWRPFAITGCALVGICLLVVHKPV